MNKEITKRELVEKWLREAKIKKERELTYRVVAIQIQPEEPDIKIDQQSNVSRLIV